MGLTMSWYYVDSAGATKGPISIAQLTALNKCPNVLKQVKPSPQRKAAPGAPSSGQRRRRRRRRRKSPFGGGGGGRAGLLDAIRAGKKLNKTPAPKENGPSGGSSSGSSSRSSNKPMSLMEQMKAAQNKRKKGGGAKKKSPVRAPVKKAEPAWKKKPAAKKAAEANKSSSPSSGSGSLGARKDKIVNKLKNAQEWQLKAIEKILQ